MKIPLLILHSTDIDYDDENNIQYKNGITTRMIMSANVILLKDSKQNKTFIIKNRYGKTNVTVEDVGLPAQLFDLDTIL